MSWLRRTLYARRALGTPLQPHYALPLPALATPWHEAELLALDFETSGLDIERDRILSMGWVRISKARIQMGSARHLLVRADAQDTRGVGQSAVIHGLTDTDIAAGLACCEAVRLLLSELEGRVLVSHGAPIELNFLAAASRRCFGVPPTLRCIDTLALEQRIRHSEVHSSGYLRLHACRQRYGLPTYRAHNAAIDALACAELLLAQAGRIGDETRLRLRDLVA